MLVPIILLVLFLISVALLFMDFDKYIFMLFPAILIPFFGVCFYFLSLESHTPNKVEYDNLKYTYSIVTKQDSVPLLISMELCENCKHFNDKLDDIKKYENSEWVGAFYPTNQDINPTDMYRNCLSSVIN